jgi:hypothetical protein
VTVTINLGVIEIPYVENQGAPKTQRKAKRGLVKRVTRTKKSAISEVTTGDVATFLEDKYGVMEHFAEIKEKDITDAVEEACLASLEAIALGGPPEAIVPKLDKIETDFKKFIDGEGLNGLPGVPTKAALQGVQTSLKQKHGAPRASFVDTGLYRDSFKAWVE